MESLFKNYEIPKSRITNERQIVVKDILELVNGTTGIKKKLTPRSCAVYLSPYSVADLYVFVSKLKLSKTPASMFWWYVKNMKPKKDLTPT